MLKTGNVIVATLLLILMVLAGVQALTFKAPAETGAPGPAYAPVGLAVIGGLLCCSIIVMSVIKEPKAHFDVSSKLFLYTAILIAYVSIIPLVGYYIPTFVFLGVMMWLLGVRKAGLIVLVSFGFPTAIFLIFSIALQLPMP